MAQTYNYPDTLFGDTFEGVQFTVTVNASPLDLTGATIKTEFRDLFSGALVKTLEIGTGITVTDAVNGVFQVDAFIVDIPVGNHKHDVQITLADSRVKTYITGSWEILQDVTQ